MACRTRRCFSPRVSSDTRKKVAHKPVLSPQSGQNRPLPAASQVSSGGVGSPLTEKARSPTNPRQAGQLEAGGGEKEKTARHRRGAGPGGGGTWPPRRGRR